MASALPAVASRVGPAEAPMRADTVVPGTKPVVAKASRGKLWGVPALATALVLALAIRVAFSRYPLWYDELASVFFASQPLSRLWSGWMVRETNPPLYYTILHVWIDAFGRSETSLRLLSVGGSLFAMTATYAGMKGRFGAKAASIAVLLMAVSAQHLAFAEEVRAYVFLYTAIAISFFGLLTVASDRDRPLAGWFAYGAGALAAIYLHTTALLWPAAASLALMVVDGRYRPLAGSRWRSLVLANLLVGIGAGWWLAVTALQMQQPNGNISWIAWPGWGQLPALFASSILLVQRLDGAPEPLLIATGALSIWGAAATWGRRDTRLAVACLGFSIALFVLCSLKQPILVNRTLFWLSIFPLTVLSAGLATLRGWVFSAVAVPLVIGLGLNLARVAPTLPREHWAEAARALANDPEAVLVVDGESMAVAMQMTCAVETGAKSCPFPIVTVKRPGDDIDHWARDGVRSFAPRDGARPTLSTTANVYLFRRGYHDVLSDLRVLGVLPGGSEPGAALVGPLPGSVLADLETHGRWDGGLFYLDKAVPIR